MHEQEPTEGQVDRFGQEEVFSGLGDGDHLAEGGRRRGGNVPGGRVAVDGIDASVASHDLSQRHRNVASTGADVDAAPPGADAQAFEGGGDRAPVDIVTKGMGHWAKTLPSDSACNLAEVKVTMLLCDGAQVADGKLYVLGGGWSLTGPDPMPSAIAMKIDVGWHEAEQAHHWELYLEDADGRPVLVDTPEGTHPIEVRGEFNVARPETVPEGTPIDVALAVNLGPLPLETGNRYTWRLTIDGDTNEDWALGFTTRPRPEE
jgi:hypothetical protein